MSIEVFALVAAVFMAAVHVFAGRLRFLEGIPRSRWLSMASGVSVAYVFVHLLPELAAHQASFEGMGGFLEHHVYLVALLGLAVFYGLERMAESSKDHQKAATGEDVTSPGVFWLHIGSFGLYNVLIGYLLLHREQTTLMSLAFFAGAMILHFLVNDFGLRGHYQARYHRYGRWILAAAVLGGLALGYGLEIGDRAIAVLFAFLAGGVVLNVLKEELPRERQSRFWAFAVGAAVYTLLLLAI